MLLTSSVLVDLLLLLGLLLYLSYKYLSRNHGYWQKRGVYTPKFVPVVGHLLDIVLGRYTFPELFKRHYDKTNEKYFGLYFFDDPIFFVKDPELIKNIMVKDSNFFNDRAVGIPKHDEVQSNLMFFQKSPAWKVLRTKSTPAFTSAKLKFMMPLISECANEMIDYLLENQGVLEARELAVKYSTNVIAICAFGINAGCFRNSKAEFRERAKPIFKNTWKNAAVQAIYFLKPSWLDRFKLEFFDKNSVDYFTDVFLETMNNRPNDVKYNDLIDILKDLQKHKEIAEVELDEAKIVAIAIMFFIAAFETTSGTISFTLYELCVNKNVQNKLREEINDFIDKFGEITYESVKELRYLDCCINDKLDAERKLKIDLNNSIPPLPRMVRGNSELLKNSSELADFANERTFLVLSKLNVNTSFIKQHPTKWKSDEAYSLSKLIVDQLKVVNDLAKIGVKLIQDYNKLMTNDDANCRRIKFCLQFLTFFQSVDIISNVI